MRENFDIKIYRSSDLWCASALGCTAGGSTIKEAVDLWFSMIIDRAIEKSLPILKEISRP